MQKIIISSCLLGELCRYDGNEVSKNTMEIMERILPIIKENFEIISVCPEIMGNLTVPRDPAEIVNERVMNSKGIDVTEQYNVGATITMDMANKEQIEIALLKAKSPSCGSFEIYDGTFTGKLIKGEGITTKHLRRNGIKVFSELDFEDKMHEII